MRTFRYVAQSCSLAILICASAVLAAAFQSAPSGSSQSPQMESGQSAPMGMSKSPQRASAQDKQFIMKASEGSLAEVQLGKLALQKSQNAEVKQFAQKMVEDHTMLINNMKPFSDQLGGKPPTKPNAKHQQLAYRLKSLSGDQFDKEYIKAMVADHHHDLGEFMAEESKAGDPGLKQTVTQGTQVIHECTQMIDEIAKKNGIATPPMQS
jgi:putative membrane protein